MTDPMPTAAGLPPRWAAFCKHRRTAIKDGKAHPYLDRYWADCIKIDSYSRERVLELRDRLFQDLIAHAAAHVPFYREWAKRTGYQPGDTARLEDLPVLTKADYIEDIDRFQSSAYRLDEMGTSKTSGSSGEPFRFRTHKTVTDYNYCVLWRAMGRHGLRPGMRRAYVWGRSWQFSTGGLRTPIVKGKLAIRDWLNNTLTVNAYEVTDRNVAGYLDQIDRFKPEYMHGYVSALYAMARHMLEHGRRFEGFTLRAVVTDSEKVYPFQKQAMTEAFGCPVLEHYGSVELGSIAEPDPHGHMRLNEDLHWAETSVSGEAIITNLRAHAYPFIRYRLGDILELSGDAPPGLPYATLNSIVGRTVDLIPVATGGYVHGVALAHVIDPHLDHVQRYQVHQQAIDRVVVSLIVKHELPDAVRQKIISDMKDLLGEAVEVVVEVVDHIEPAASGKYRWVMSDVSDVAKRTFEHEADAASRSTGG